MQPGLSWHGTQTWTYACGLTNRGHVQSYEYHTIGVDLGNRMGYIVQNSGAIAISILWRLCRCIFFYQMALTWAMICNVPAVLGELEETTQRFWWLRIGPETELKSDSFMKGRT